MPFVAFHERCPDVASRETRSINLLPGAKAGVPAGRCEFVEMYCGEPDCDCRRVFFSVRSSVTNHVEAVIACGWEDCAFYKRWLGMDEPHIVSEMQGPVLNLGSPQSGIAEDLLELARSCLL